jgi:hypothetical protein
MLFLFMKSFFRINVLVFTGLVFLGLFSGCAQDEAVTVKGYNNTIVEIQKDMFGKAQEASKAFEVRPLQTEQIMAALQRIQSEISQSHDRFKAMPVPKGGEQLADAMGRFFQVEINGIQRIIAGVEQLKGKESDPEAMKAFTAVFQEFNQEESQALRDFYATQQQVAGKYGQEVIQVEE